MHLSTTHVAVLVVALLTVTAGCGGLSDDPETTTVESPTSTTTLETTGTGPPDTGTTTDGPATTPATERFPPGFDDDGIVSVQAVIQGHDAAMANSSASVRYWLVNRSNSGRLSFDADAGTAALNSTVGSTDVDAYVDDGTGYHRVVTADNRSYDVTNLSVDGLRRGAALPAISRSLYLSNFSHAESVEGEDGTVHHFEIVGVNSGLQQYDPAAFSNVSGHLQVDDGGRIVDYEWNGSYNGSQQSYGYQVTELEDVSVTRPAWVDQAEANATSDS